MGFETFGMFHGVNDSENFEAVPMGFETTARTLFDIHAVFILKQSLWDLKRCFLMAVIVSRSF